MYSGTTLHNKSGNLIGAHQKFDRSARKMLEALRPASAFPTAKLILHFEGNNGPDGIKRKSPGVDEPWHYWDPTDPKDTTLLAIIRQHFDSLIVNLSSSNSEKAAFEAAWLAHAIVDGLTSPHHYPFEAKLTALRGEGLETRTSIKDKLVIQGDTKREMLRKNWQMWGAKGLMLSHASFEWGVSSTVKPMKFAKFVPQEATIRHAKTIGIEAFMKEQAITIYDLNMYERYLRRGWSTKMIRQIRRTLAPTMVQTIAVLWALALDEAVN